MNAAICYYAALAREAKIRFEAAADYPENCPVSDTDAAVLLENMLENAIEACRRDSDGLPFIKRRGNSSLLILADNACREPATFQDGVPLFSKRTGPGIGAASIREIAARYGGSAQFEQRDGVFYASVLLHIAS